MQPNFLVIGGMRCGSTSFCNYLEQHPDVFFSKPKEPNFFCYDNEFARGMDWYKSLFNEVNGEKAVGEGTTSYSINSWFPKTSSRIYNSLGPKIRLIYIVRHPLRQIESLYMLRKLKGLENMSYSRAVHENKLYLDAANYLLQIDVYRELYPDQQIKVVFFEDLIASPENEMSKCFQFLGVNPVFSESIDYSPQNVTKNRDSDRMLLKTLKSLKLYSVLFKLIPTEIKSLVRPLFKWSFKSSRPTSDQIIRNYVTNEIGQDTKRFLIRYGKGIDFWSLED